MGSPAPKAEFASHYSYCAAGVEADWGSDLSVIFPLFGTLVHFKSLPQIIALIPMKVFSGETLHTFI